MYNTQKYSITPGITLELLLHIHAHSSPRPTIPDTGDEQPVLYPFVTWTMFYTWNLKACDSWKMAFVTQHVALEMAALVKFQFPIFCHQYVEIQLMFCILAVYMENRLNGLISTNRFSINSLEFTKQTTVLCANKPALLLPFHTVCLLPPFFASWH